MKTKRTPQFNLAISKNDAPTRARLRAYCQRIGAKDSRVAWLAIAAYLDSLSAPAPPPPPAPTPPAAASNDESYGW